MVEWLERLDYGAKRELEAWVRYAMTGKLSLSTQP